MRRKPRLPDQLHGFFAPRSKKAVSTRMSLPSGRWATLSTRPCAGEIARKARVTEGSSGSGAVQSGAMTVASTHFGAEVSLCDANDGVGVEPDHVTKLGGQGILTRRAARAEQERWTIAAVRRNELQPR